jgi:elongation factor G
MPIGYESDFAGVIDLVEDEGVVWQRRGAGRQVGRRRHPRRHGRDKADEYRQELLDVHRHHDDEHPGEVPRRRGDHRGDLAPIRKATIANDFVPMLNGSAFKNKGVQPLLDAVVDYLPSPARHPAGQGTERPRARRDPPARPDVERAVLGPGLQDRGRPPRQAHLLPGVLGHSSTRATGPQQPHQGAKERVGRILLMHANNREDLDFVYAGDIVAGIGLKNTRTGDTLCDEKATIILESLTFPEPVIHVAVEPKTKADQDKMGKALYSLSEEDPTFRSAPTRRRARPSSPAWASCTSRCSSTA